MEHVSLYRPGLEELSFRQELLADPDTMAYNHAYGGTIRFPRERWVDWYARWVEDGCPESPEAMARIAMRLLFINPGEPIEL